MPNPCSTRAPPPAVPLSFCARVRTVVTTFCFSGCHIFPIRLPLSIDGSGCGTHGAEERDDARGGRKEANSYSCISRTSGDGSGRRSNETIWVFSSPGCRFLALIGPVTTEGWSSCGTQGADEGGSTAARTEMISFDQKVGRVLVSAWRAW